MASLLGKQVHNAGTLQRRSACVCTCDWPCLSTEAHLLTHLNPEFSIINVQQGPQQLKQAPCLHQGCGCGSSSRCGCVESVRRARAALAATSQFALVAHQQEEFMDKLQPHGACMHK